MDILTLAIESDGTEQTITTFDFYLGYLSTPTDISNIIFHQRIIKNIINFIITGSPEVFAHISDAFSKNNLIFSDNRLILALHELNLYIEGHTYRSTYFIIKLLRKEAYCNVNNKNISKALDDPLTVIPKQFRPWPIV